MGRAPLMSPPSRRCRHARFARASATTALTSAKVRASASFQSWMLERTAMSGARPRLVRLKLLRWPEAQRTLQAHEACFGIQRLPGSGRWPR